MSPRWLTDSGPCSAGHREALDATINFHAWRNEVAARVVLQLSRYRPGRLASRIAAPVLFCVCESDATTPPGSSIDAARRAPRGELRRYPYGHFAIYHDPQVKADQVEFLSRVLGG